MALRINETIGTKEGFTVPSGTLVKFNTIFPYKDLEVHYNMKFYRSQASYDNDDMAYSPSALTSMGHVEVITLEEYTGLTPTAVHQKLKDYLGGIYTGGTIDIVI